MPPPIHVVAAPEEFETSTSLRDLDCAFWSPAGGASEGGCQVEGGCGEGGGVEEWMGGWGACGGGGGDAGGEFGV